MRNLAMPLAAGVLLASGTIALAQTAAAPKAPPVENTTVTGEGEVVCVHNEAPTGSRFGAKKVCHTAAEWRVIHANAQDSIRYMQDRHDNMVEGRALAAGQ
ncbi:MAG TPA: hypothetical protein VHC39_15630 [Rhizomicrobium sp.]|nr:hypothetical protein [Rhizomicrobium sp.]